MKNKKLTRTCIACRAKKQKNELIRMVARNSEIIKDEKQKLEGRGAYICSNSKCLEIATKSNKLKRALKI
ncbi:MAG: YlxR family protein [Clostridia bacterium]|nr:YlxR family protein [Clostridia bacterium]